VKQRRRCVPKLFGLMLVAQVTVSCQVSAPTSPPSSVPSLPPPSTSVLHSPAPSATATSEAPLSVVATEAPAPARTPWPTATDEGQTDAFRTLGSLEKVDAYPLYTMRYYGTYGAATSSTDSSHIGVTMGSQAEWGCSLFAALGQPDAAVYGRNFDWQFSPALLLFTDPPDGYASVSMVDIGYLIPASQVHALTDLPLEEREPLLGAPFWPFDGMNEHGLVVGMAAVPGSPMPVDPDRETIGSLGVIREMLDRARDVDEAVDVLESYNIAWDGGPALHYLIADASGDSVLVEFYAGKMVLIPRPDDSPWHLATNHLRAQVERGDSSGCWRYDTIHRRLATGGGRFSITEAMDLLDAVSQENTQWSAVYDLASLGVHVAMGRAYESTQVFQLSSATH